MANKINYEITSEEINKNTVFISVIPYEKIDDYLDQPEENFSILICKEGNKFVAKKYAQLSEFTKEEENILNYGKYEFRTILSGKTKKEVLNKINNELLARCL